MSTQKPKITQNPKDNKKPWIFYYLIVIATIFLFNLLVVPWIAQRQIEYATYSQFLHDIDAGRVEQVQLEEDQILYQTKEDSGKKIYKTGKIDDPDLVARLSSADISFEGIIPEKPSLLLSILLGYGLPILIFVLIGYFIRRSISHRMGNAGLNIPGAKGAIAVYEPDEENKTFADVAGQAEAKESLIEVIDYLNQPEKYQRVGAQCPKGVLLVGPPGTGKTLIAKAVAGEAHIPFFAISGSEFVEMFVCRGAAKVRELFEQAEKHAPCIVFIDEIDTIGKSRDGQVGNNDEREQTLNQLLTEMDGFEGNKGVVILAATNRPEVLDPALLRPGRFDRQVPVELPDLKGREDILKVHLRPVRTAEHIDYNLIARMTSGASGAQMANIVNEAALRTVRQNREYVTTEDLISSIETVIAGAVKKNAILSDEEKKIVAYHETGHALIAALQTHSAPVQKITIVPRTSGALGYVMQVEKDERSLMSKTQILNQIEVLCAGRAAEEVVFNEITTGASNDIEKATALARQMITTYGMSQTFGMVNLAEKSSQYLGGAAKLSCSDETSHLIDLEVQGIIKEAYQKAKRTLSANRDKLDELADYLYQEETITGEQFMKILDS